MHRTPPKTDEMEKVQSEPSRSETDHESDSKVTSRRMKRRRSPEVDINTTLNTFQKNFSEHMTKLFTAFQESQDAKFSALMSDVNEIKHEVTEMKKLNTDIENKIEVLTVNYEHVSTKTTKLVSDLQSSAEKIQYLENKVEELNRQSCAYKIEMRNIPSKEQEKSDDVLQLVNDVFKILKVEIQPNDVRSVRRLPGKPDSSRPILIELATSTIKTHIIREARNYNKKNTAKLNTSLLSCEGLPKPFYIGENLTYKAKGLLYRAREFAKQNNYAFCWTHNGQVLLRKDESAKSTIVKNEEQLKNMESTSA